MCVVAVGMAEVSSCEITAKEGDAIEKGQELGMFHFGGSTHCLLFRRGVDLEFVDFAKQYHTGPIGLDATNVPVNSQLARVSSASL
jgi:phosphatidylserine decarboxylase